MAFPWKIFKHSLLIALFSLFVIVSHQIEVRAENCDENYDKGHQSYYECLQRNIDELGKQLSESVNATKPLENQVSQLKKQIDSYQAQITSAQKKNDQLTIAIKDRESKISEQYKLLSTKVRAYYKKAQYYSPIFMLVASRSAMDFARGISYQSTAVNDDKDQIITITADILSLENDKKEVEASKAQLLSLQAKLDKQKKFFDEQIATAKFWQSELTNKIAALSAKQQSFLAAKLGSLNLPTSLGGGTLSCVDDRKIDPGFSNAFAFYTYGIPHRVGLDQYGAYGRANAGQNAEQILRAYFNVDEFRGGVDATIRVNDSNGFNQGNIIWTGSLEDYVKRIYEMPGGWPSAALEAQAIAARSYVLATTDNGSKSICANQHCQVFKKDPKGGAWEQAVLETSGKVMVTGGQIITAWYASTAGGYTFTNSDVWGGSQKPWTKRLRDTNGDTGNFGDLQSRAYGKDSPCFYSAQGARSQYNKSAWLKSEEVADIVNVLLLAKRDGSTQTHLSQVDKANPDGAETWDSSRVRSELSSRGGSPYTSISSITVSADFGTGRTTGVTVSGDGGTQTFNGTEFVDYFNLRAPANIQIVGPLFNVERR